MNGETDLVTVYRSGDANADEDAAAAHRYLNAHGIKSVIFNDNERGVVQGSCEVRVAASEAAQAEALLANYNPDEAGEVDPSSELDLEPIASLMGATAEMEALAIKGLLDAAEIPAVIVGASDLPNLGFQVSVARANVATAKELLLDAESGGPAAAAEAERESEMNPTAGPQA